MELLVDIRINPPPKDLDARQMDEMLNGELVGFEKWFIERQRSAGLQAGPLIGAERGVVKAYILYCSTARREGE
jgi:hypothetical protein